MNKNIVIGGWGVGRGGALISKKKKKKKIMKYMLFAGCFTFDTVFI